MIDRRIFTSKPSRLETFADYALAAVIGVALAYGALVYFS